MLDGEASAAMLAAKLGALLRGKSAPRDREAAWQDSLDLLAVVCGAKPIALLGVGYEAGVWLDAVATLAGASGLIVRRGGMPWLVESELVGLPDWYAEPLREAWAGSDILSIGRPADIAPFGAAPVLRSVAEEAELLGYSACCVTDHHAGRRGFHALMAELILARFESEAERRRFAASELPPPLRDDADRRRLAATLPMLPSLPFAGFTPCPVCAALGLRGPAGQVDARMRALAETSSLAPLAIATEG